MVVFTNESIKLIGYLEMGDNLNKLFLLILLLFISSCSVNQSMIKDTVTLEKVDHIKVKDQKSIIIYKNLIDSMVRSHAEYEGSLAIDTSYYNDHLISRGDVIYFKTPTFEYDSKKMTPSSNGVLRVIALPGETFAIKNGQIMINGMKLDAFYGKISWWGLDEKQFNEEFKKPSSGFIKTEANKKYFHEYYNQNKKQISVPQDSYYVLGDTSGRSIDSLTFGSLSKNLILGKVLGYPED
jgi:signal peptidase I